MANVNNPSGFVPYTGPGTGSGNAQITEHDLLATNAEIGIGSPVKVAAGGVELAAASDALCGIAAEYKAASDSSLKIKIWSDPDQLFVAQTDDGTGTATALAAVGLNINMVGTGVTNRRSTSELDETSATTTATLPFKIMKLSDEYQGRARNAFGEFNRLVVKINNHQFGSSTGTVGI